MVLQKVGESTTEIQVNGTTEYGPASQSDDSVYDVSVSAPSFKLIDNAFGFHGDFTWSGNDSMIYMDLDFPTGTTISGFIEYDFSTGSEDNFELYINDTLVDDNQNNADSPLSANFSVNDQFKLEVFQKSGGEDVNNARFTDNCDVDVTLPDSSVTVNGVTKS